MLYVWSSREFSIAVVRSIDAGVHRPDSRMRSIRSIAAGEHSASHRPPSLAKHFCGAK